MSDIASVSKLDTTASWQSNGGSTDAVMDVTDEKATMYGLGMAGPALLFNDIMTDQQYIEIAARNSSPIPVPQPTAYKCPMPQQPVSRLRPQLAQILTSNVVMPAVQIASTAGLHGPRGLSALEAVIEDGESLHLSAHSMLNQHLLERLQLVYSQTATSLALMADTVRTYGYGSGGRQGEQDEKQFCGMINYFGR
eukprot:gene6233-6470_t